MSIPELSIGRELQGNDGNWYRILEELSDYSVRVWDFQENKESTVEKHLFATY